MPYFNLAYNSGTFSLRTFARLLLLLALPAHLHANEPAQKEAPKTLPVEPTNSSPNISRRILRERKTAFDPNVISPHKMNYVLPLSTATRFNDSAYKQINTLVEPHKQLEAKFQLSLKAPLNQSSLLIKDDGLFFGMTLTSWWQVYSAPNSRPFRETNYQPELFYWVPINWGPIKGGSSAIIGVEHQSNGQSLPLSRSWNRVYMKFIYEDTNYTISLRPWWRIPEDEKDGPSDPEGDDNPTIDDYMGHFELTGAYLWSHYEFNTLVRHNFSTGKGATELGMTFPLWPNSKLRGYIQYFEGYGESLIEYDIKQRRFGIGVALTDML